MSIKNGIRDTVSELLYMAGVTSPKWCGRSRFSIVTFHRVLPNAQRHAYPFPGLAVTPEEFDSFMMYFTEHFDCGTLEAQHDRYMNGEDAARPLLAITFDDAQYDNYVNARPILARHQINASFFVPVVAVERQELLWHDRLGFAILQLLGQVDSGREKKLMQILDGAGLSPIGSRDLVGNIVEASKSMQLQARLSLIEKLADASGTYNFPEFARLMTFSEIAELAADGHEIGSHSMTHCLMTECDDQSLMYEIAESRRVLQTRLGLSIESFCYPNGNSDTGTARAVAKAGYRRAVTTTWGGNSRNGDKFQLHRYNMDARYMSDSNGKIKPAVLAFKMSGFYPGLNWRLL